MTVDLLGISVVDFLLNREMLIASWRVYLLVAVAQPIEEIDVAIEKLLRETKASIPSHRTNGNPSWTKPSKRLLIALVQNNPVDPLGQRIPLGNDLHKPVDILLAQNMSIVVASAATGDRDPRQTEIVGRWLPAVLSLHLAVDYLGRSFASCVSHR
jgi:hypothetical protein